MTKHVKSIVSGLLAAIMVVSSVVPAWADEAPEAQEENAVIEVVEEETEELPVQEEEAESAATEEKAVIEEEEEEPVEEVEEDNLRLAGAVAIDDFTVDGIKTALHDGTPKTCDITVTDPEGKVLVEDTDYTVAYNNNTDVGEATVTITGIGDYTGTIERTFSIRYPITRSEITEIPAQKYAAKRLTPAVTVTYEGRVLTEGVDYTLKYSSNQNASTDKAKVVITGIGDFTGSATRYFTIGKVSNKIKVGVSTKTTLPYSVKKQTLKLKATALDPKTVLTYKSNTSKVKVSKSGTVSVAKEFIGTAKITITAPATKNTTKATKTVRITVKPPVLAGKDMIQRYMTKNPEYRANKKLEVKGLMLHSVNCPVPSAMSFINKWDSKSYNRASIHAFVDANTGEVYNTLPWTVQAGHCASGPKGSGNKTHIGVEMCEASCIYWIAWNKISCSNYSKARAAAKRTYKSSVDLFAMLCVQFNLNPLKKGVIISHTEGWEQGIASDHGDPENLWKALGLSYTMNGFRKDVKKAMKKYQ